MGDSESGIAAGSIGSMREIISPPANWPEEKLMEFFGNLQYDANQIYLDNVPDETITTFHHGGKTRMLNKQELINLLWGCGSELADAVPEWREVKLNAFEFNLTVRIMTCFHMAGMYEKSISELFDFMREQDVGYRNPPGWATLLKLRNFGRKSLIDLVRALQEIGVPREVLTSFRNYPNG